MTAYVGYEHGMDTSASDHRCLCGETFDGQAALLDHISDETPFSEVSR